MAFSEKHIKPEVTKLHKISQIQEGSIYVFSYMWNIVYVWLCSADSGVERRSWEGKKTPWGCWELLDSNKVFMTWTKE